MAKRKISGTRKVNRKYKDTVFRMIFSDRKNLLSLYNAIGGTAYSDSEELEIVTLENAVYMGMKNDLAFIINTNLFLYEHQSTYNPNMPMRDLFYIASEYQKLIDDKSLYSSVLQKVPAPKFLVFYNGAMQSFERICSICRTSKKICARNGAGCSSVTRSRRMYSRRNFGRFPATESCGGGKSEHF